MAEPIEYTVARDHLGDEITDDGLKARQFVVGDKRLADPVIVAALVKSGVLVEPKGKAKAKPKADPAHKDKADAVHADKASPKAGAQ